MWERRSVHSGIEYCKYTPKKRNIKGKQIDDMLFIWYKKFANKEREYYANDQNNNKQ